MVYFSSAPVRLDSVNEEQYKKLMEFKEECRPQGLLETYESSTEFRQKFQRQLATKINADEYFAIRDAPQVTGLALLPEQDVPLLSEEAKELLLAAAEDQDGNVMSVAMMSGRIIQTNGRQFIEDGNPRSRAAWEGALQELVSNGLLEAIGYKNEIFQMTREGYKMAELLKR